MLSNYYLINNMLPPDITNNHESKDIEAGKQENYNTQKYHIIGLKCMNCCKSIKRDLKKIEGIIDIIIEFETKELIIKTENVISDRVLNSVITKKDIYLRNQESPLIESKDMSNKISMNIYKPQVVKTHKEKSPGIVWCLSKFQPLLIILAYIIVSSILMEIREPIFEGMRFCSYIMGWTFLYFSFLKMLNLCKFAKSFQKYDLISRFIPIYSYFYPFIEGFLSIMFFYRLFPIVINSIALFLLVINLIGVVIVLKSGKSVDCACVGAVFKLPMTVVTIIEDLIMIIMCIVMLAMS